MVLFGAFALSLVVVGLVLVVVVVVVVSPNQTNPTTTPHNFFQANLPRSNFWVELALLVSPFFSFFFLNGIVIGEPQEGTSSPGGRETPRLRGKQRVANVLV